MAKCRESDKKWRRFIKNVIVTLMGGKCVCCGYNKCNSALEFHHINPQEKDFGFADYKYDINASRWPDIISELKKCVLVCSNCHREIHDKIIETPNVNISFSNEFNDFSIIKKFQTFIPCPICGDNMPDYSITCSNKCSGKKAHINNYK